MTDRTRFSGLFDAQQRMVTLIGVGGIGSLLAITLAKMGFHLNLFDDDIVSPENTGTQFYGDSQVGQPKLEAISDALRLYVPDTFVYCNQGRIGVPPLVGEYGCNMLQGQIVISGVDSIQARKDIWQVLTYNNRPAFDWYIDLRMGLLDLYAFVVDSRDTAWYEQELALVNDELLGSLPCTSKATYFTAAGASCLAGIICKRILLGEALPRRYALNINDWLAVTI